MNTNAVSVVKYRKCCIRAWMQLSRCGVTSVAARIWSVSSPLPMCQWEGYPTKDLLAAVERKGAAHPPALLIAAVGGISGLLLPADPVVMEGGII